MTAIDAFIAQHGAIGLVAAMAVLAAGGLAKGAVGFALPMIAISGLGAFLPAQTAVAVLILPTFFANLWQALFTGWRDAAATLRKYWLLNLALLPTIALASQLLAVLDEKVVFMILGVGVTLFSLAQLLRLRMPDPSGAPRVTQIATGFLSGIFGGISGVWGPPILMYLIARNTPKAEQVRAMGISFFFGSIVLTGGHTFSGILNAGTAPVSALGVIPVMAGMAVGIAIQNRMDQAGFRRATLVVLVVAGLNLLRRALTL